MVCCEYLICNKFSTKINRILTFFLGMGFHILVDSMRVYIKLDTIYFDNVRGLCGTFNSKSSDDWMPPNGFPESDLIAFVDSYKINSLCETGQQIKPTDIYYDVCLYFIKCYCYISLYKLKIIILFFFQI